MVSRRLAPVYVVNQIYRHVRLLVTISSLTFAALVAMSFLHSPLQFGKGSSKIKIVKNSNRQHYLTDLLLSDTNKSKHLDDPMINPPSADLKPVFLAMNPSYTRNISEKHKHHLTVHTYGGLGNNMFAYASMLGIAEENYMIPTLVKDNRLRKYFKITAKICEKETIDEWPLYEERMPCAYDPTTEKLNYEMNIALMGFFQSWKYFDNIKHRIRDEFVFKDEIDAKASAFIANNVQLLTHSKEDRERTILIGVHIRRGDLLEQYNIDKGYTVASVHYIKSAMRYFSGIYENNRLLFIICSDDISWAKRHINFVNSTQLAFSNTGNEAIDLAILSKCNHMIMTVGTYGWWAAWLAGGKTLYYKHYPAPFSILSDLFIPDHYFYPSWIGL